ncbi:hypothetical protein SDC9_156611 [bioreactor metagenome]|uniref:Uncharacterized protein n=1 Tax=bioreactor metagenome TaxID=1076179 RepID=A0A645F716_9ZZZZ
MMSFTKLTTLIVNEIDFFVPSIDVAVMFAFPFINAMMSPFSSTVATLGEELFQVKVCTASAGSVEA